jgi:hypothetical protein
MASSQALARHLFTVEKRRAERDEVFFGTTMFVHGGITREVQVVNLSPFGFLVRAADDIAERSRVKLKLPVVGPVDASIVWTLGGRAGGEFGKAIDGDLYREMLVAARAQRSARWID